jgi:phospholipase A-2-activating protein
MMGEARNALKGVCSDFFNSTIRVWTLAGDVVYTLSASTAFIFCLAILPSGDIVTGGEDRAVSVWRGEFDSVFYPSFSASLIRVLRR